MAKALTQDQVQGKPAVLANKSVRKSLRNSFNVAFVTTLAAALLFIFLAPFLFMVFTSLKTQGQIAQLGAPIWPAKPTTFDYNGKTVEVYKVPMSA
jgi:ABC-type glycerol-3-phosphate transport system permease component